MVSIGDIKLGREIGRKGTQKTAKFIYQACTICGSERWLRYLTHKIRSLKCPICANRERSSKRIGDNSNQWKGGRYLTSDGYVCVRIFPDDFFYSMVSKDSGSSGVVFEHRLVIAKNLGRCLHRWEIVHHKNGVKGDNRLENLELTSLGSHTLRHNKGYTDGFSQGYNDGKDKRIKELENQINILKEKYG